jgi:nucleoside-diphosphate-sugar epimerase
MEKARRMLGWQPRVDIEEGVQKSKPWMKEAGLL